MDRIITLHSTVLMGETCDDNVDGKFYCFKWTGAWEEPDSDSSDSSEEEDDDEED